MSANFKVIIAGGGPAGLVAAHSLHLAGVDFVVLEQRDDIKLDVGASLVLAPQSLRVMQQFGIYDQLMEIGAEVDHNLALTPEGHAFGDSHSFKYMKENHGSGPVAFHRAHLIGTIYDGLPEAAKSRVLTGKKISSVVSNKDSVTVTCTDGSSYTGSVLIGADGVHSQTRKHMRRLAMESSTSSSSSTTVTTELSWDPEVPYTSAYRVVWFSFPAATAPGIMSETHKKDHSTMYIAGKTRGWVFLYEKLPSGPTTARANYSQQDCDKFAESYFDFSITPELKVRDVWPSRFSAGMSNLEEGVVSHWTYSRIALVGDAAHKYTPNGGLGLNNGIQDVVSLCNGLVALQQDQANQTNPSLDALTKVFEIYQNTRRPLATEDFKTSARATRMQSDASLSYYFFGHWVMWFGFVRYLLMNWVAPKSIRKGLVLEYVKGKEPFKGLVGWEHPMQE